MNCNVCCRFCEIYSSVSSSRHPRPIPSPFCVLPQFHSHKFTSHRRDVMAIARQGMAIRRTDSPPPPPFACLPDATDGRTAIVGLDSGWVGWFGSTVDRCSAFFVLHWPINSPTDSISSFFHYFTLYEYEQQREG